MHSPEAVPGNAAPDISLVIATFAKLGHLRSCLAAIAQLAGVPSFEAVVVNDGSPDKTREFIDGYQPTFPLRAIHIANSGLANARNVGLRHARGRLAIILDDDCLVHSNVLNSLWAAFCAAPDRLFLSSVRHVPTNHVSAVAQDLERGARFPLPERLLTSRAEETALQTILRAVKEHLPALQVGWFGAQGPSVAGAVSLFRSLDGYDTQIRSYGMEDFDFGLRFCLQDGHLQWVPASVIYHLDHGHGATELFSGTAASTNYFYRKHGSLPQIKPFLRFLTGEITFLECNNRVAALCGSAPCEAPELDIGFSIYRMLDQRQAQLGTPCPELVQPGISSVPQASC